MRASDIRTEVVTHCGIKSVYTTNLHQLKPGFPELMLTPNPNVKDIGRPLLAMLAMWMMLSDTACADGLELSPGDELTVCLRKVYNHAQLFRHMPIVSERQVSETPNAYQIVIPVCMGQTYPWQMPDCAPATAESRLRWETADGLGYRQARAYEEAADY